MRYNGLIVSDDMDMGAVLKFAPIEQTVVQHIRAGGDLALIGHKEEMVVRAYEALIHEAERDRRFAQRARKSARRVLAFKRKYLLRRRPAAPSSAQIEKLTRQLWEFGEEIRIGTLAREEPA